MIGAVSSFGTVGTVYVAETPQTTSLLSRCPCLASKPNPEKYGSPYPSASYVLFNLWKAPVFVPADQSPP